jgi:TRAP-type C4-dicarboxylate transport system permease small subunit
MLARIWDKSLAALVASSYVVIVGVGFAQVLFRFVFSSPLSWSEELVRYVFVWSVFLTAAIAFHLNSHISIDFLTSRYPPRLQRTCALASWVAVILAVAILFVLGMQLVQAPSVRFQKSPAMEIPMTVPYAAIPVGCAVMMVNILRGAWRTWRGPQAPAAHIEVA